MLDHIPRREEVRKPIRASGLHDTQRTKHLWMTLFGCAMIKNKEDTLYELQAYLCLDTRQTSQINAEYMSRATFSTSRASDASNAKQESTHPLRPKIRTPEWDYH